MHNIRNFNRALPRIVATGLALAISNIALAVTLSPLPIPAPSGLPSKLILSSIDTAPKGAIPTPAGGASAPKAVGEPMPLAFNRVVTGSTIVIGQSISLSNGMNAYGAATSEGIRLAFDEVNKKGGVNGRNIVLNILDDGGKPLVAEANAKKLLNEGAFMLFGPMEDGPAIAVAKVAEASRAVLFGPMAGAPGLRQPHKEMVFPLRAPHRVEHRKLLGFAKTVGYEKFAFFHSTSPAGLAHLANVKLEAERTNTNLVVALPYSGDITDAQLDAHVATMRAAGVESVLNHGSPKLLERLIERSKLAGFEPHFLAVNSGSTEIAKNLGKDSVGIVFSQVVPDPSMVKYASINEFRALWKANNPNRPLSYGGLEGYMTAKALIMALERVKGPLSTATLVSSLYAAPLEMDGLWAEFKKGDHQGMLFVDISAVGRNGKFIH